MPSKISRRQVCALTAFVALLLAAFNFGVTAQGPSKGTFAATTESRAGLQRAIINTTKGASIYVNLPGDMSPGDTISGTVFTEVAGTPAEVTARTDELRNLVVEVGDQKIPATNKTFQLTLPTGPALAVVLRDAAGKELTRAQLPVMAQAPAVNGDVTIPHYGSGGFIEIGCGCDGRVADSDYIKVGGEKGLVLAESPRKLVVFNASPVSGSREVEVREGGKTTTGKMTLLDIKLSAAKRSLTRGETTTLTVEVTGLEGLRENVPLNLVNFTTTTLTMEPANVQQLTITPAEVQGGKFTTKRTLTGIQPGAFHIEGTVINNSSINENSAASRAMFAETTQYVKTNNIQLQNPVSQFFGDNTEQVHLLRAAEPSPTEAKQTVAVINYKPAGKQSEFFVVESERTPDQVNYLIRNKEKQLGAFPFGITPRLPDGPLRPSCDSVNQSNSSRIAELQMKADRSCQTQYVCLPVCMYGRIMNQNIVTVNPHAEMGCPSVNDVKILTGSGHIPDSQIFTAKLSAVENITTSRFLLFTFERVIIPPCPQIYSVN